jgi:hypothetical protein
MTETERLQLAQKLAGLIGDQLPLLRNDNDLFDYAEYVKDILAGKHMDENSVLFEVMCADPRWAEDLERRRLAFRERTSHRQALPKQGSAALRKKGDQTRTKVVAAWRSFSKLPERSRATKIAERLGIRPRTVRGHLKKAREKKGNFNAEGV